MYKEKSVAVTFATQLEELEHLSPGFSNFLKVLSFLDPEGIPLNMITDGAEVLQLQSVSDSAPSNVIPPTSKPKLSLLHKLKMRFCQQRGQPVGLTAVPTDPMSHALSMMTLPKSQSLITLMQSSVQLQQAIQQLQHLSLIGYESTIDTATLRDTSHDPGECEERRSST
jgi:hypothetical protein